MQTIIQGFIGDGFHIAVPQGVGGQASGAHGFGLGSTLLDFRTNRTVVDQGSSLDHLGAVVDGNLRVLKKSM